MTTTKLQAEEKETLHKFKQLVNMTPKELQSWLETKESREVGQKQAEQRGEGEEDESIGHQSGRRIVELLHTKQADYTEADLSQMKRVISYISRHSAQRPSTDDVEHTRWRYSLMNWGHDPLK